LPATEQRFMLQQLETQMTIAANIASALVWLA
jgi:hypothetical protein